MKKETLFRIILLAVIAVLVWGGVRNIRRQLREQRYERQRNILEEQPVTRHHTGGARYRR